MPERPFPDAPKSASFKVRSCEFRWGNPVHAIHLTHANVISLGPLTSKA
jgi:hypothetical protein